MRKVIFSLVCLFFVLAIFPKSSYAIFISADMADSTDGLGDFTGNLIYSYASPTNATLSLSLNNTSDPTNGGFITAFVFNNPSDYITQVLLSSSPSNFQLLGLTDNGIDASPFGAFDFGAGISDNFLGGGNPNDGIGVGESGAFVFTLSGDNLNMLDEISFLERELSFEGNPSEPFIVRFRGFNNGGSDKVPDCYVIPEPTTLSLLGLGLLAFVRRKRR